MLTEQSILSDEILVPKDQQSDYFERNHMEMTRLPNGITIYSASRLVEDEARAKLRVHFNTGAFNDPKDRRGVHHLLEHVACSPKIQEEAQADGAFLNAATGPDVFVFKLNGIAHPDVREYVFGCIWIALPKC